MVGGYLSLVLLFLISRANESIMLMHKDNLKRIYAEPIRLNFFELSS